MTYSYYQLPITNYQLPITNYQLPITNYQLPITNYQLPITNYQLPITNYQLPGVPHLTKKGYILLIFQLPYSPELNPIERIWGHIKPEL